MNGEGQWEAGSCCRSRLIRCVFLDCPLCHRYGGGHEENKTSRCLMGSSLAWSSQPGPLVAMGPQFPHLTRQIPSRETHGAEYGSSYTPVSDPQSHGLWSAGSPCVGRSTLRLAQGSTRSRRSQRRLWPSNRENGSLVSGRCKETAR